MRSKFDNASVPAVFTPTGFAPAGFTLVELMISIAIVLILMLGINFVFSTSARTVSTGMALSNVGREIRGARKTFEADFGAAVSNDEMPALIIHNEEVIAFRDKQDRLADLDGDPATYDVDGDAANGDEVNLTTYPGAYNFRRHRADRLSFFVRNQTADYTRQTGDANTFVSTETSAEAWLCYGLLRVVTNNEIEFAKPGAGTEQSNPNNFYASQWMLGRRLTLLKEAPYSVATVSRFTGNGAATAVNLGSRAVANLTREDSGNGGPYASQTPWIMPESRIDLAETSIAQVRDFLAATPGMFYADADAPPPVALATHATFLANSPTTTLNYLFWAKPYLNKTAYANPTFAMKAQTREAALTSSIFLRGCTQFMIEFAGDFYDQGAIGGAAEPLGTVDYTVVGGIPRIHWYGMPRDVDGDRSTAAAPDPVDVNPVTTPPGNGLGGATPVARWGGTFTPQNLGAGALPDIFAWAPTVPATPGNPNNFRPSLIRITIELIDANGRLPDGQRIEFVYSLK